MCVPVHAKPLPSVKEQGKPADRPSATQSDPTHLDRCASRRLTTPAVRRHQRLHKGTASH